jgi:MFS family permease
MDVMNFLKSTFRRTNKNWILLIVEFITGLIMVPVMIIGIALPAIIIIVPAISSGYEAEDFLSYILSIENIILVLLGVLVFLIFLLFVLLIWAFVAGGIRASLLDSILKEKKFEMKTFMENCKKFFGRIVGLWSLVGLVYCGAFVVLGGIGGVIALFAVAMSENSEPGAILLGLLGGGFVFLLLALIGFVIGIYLAIANTYLIVEDAQVKETIRGTNRFLKKNIGHTLLVVVLLFAIGFGVGLVYAFVTMPLTMIPYVGGLFSIMLSPIQIALNLYLTLFGSVGYLLLILWKRKKIGSDFQTVTKPE